MNEREQTGARLMVTLNIIQQLMGTRQNKLFSQTPLTNTQFGILNHFSHNPNQSWLISELAQVMEMNQPGITKTVTVLIDKALLSATPDTFDRRKRHLRITQKGLRMCDDIMKSLLPDISHCFADWEQGDLSQMQGHLEVLMTWLDNHRDDIKHN
jgi:DNA-binding MarR family transcriptional regulator